MAKILIFIIRGYQFLLSPLFGSCCRFHPSCSSYMIESINRFGVFKGGYLGIRRLLRCHPWHQGGHDPVPESEIKKTNG